MKLGESFLPRFSYASGDSVPPRDRSASAEPLMNDVISAQMSDGASGGTFAGSTPAARAALSECCGSILGQISVANAS